MLLQSLLVIARFPITQSIDNTIFQGNADYSLQNFYNAAISINIIFFHDFAVTGMLTLHKP